MFECQQDIGLLHGCLLSVAFPYSNSLLECANMKDAVQTIYNSVKMIVHHSVNGIEDEKEKIQFQLHMNERLHAAIFFTTLRSYHIKSKAADEFYESIVYNWPSMDLKFYLELSFKCDWSEYFIMCSLQLPSEVLYEVLKMILDISLPNDVKYFSWHLILQILIIKVLEVPYDKIIIYPFNFDFIGATTNIKTECSNELAQKTIEIGEKFIYIDELTENSTTNSKSIEITDKLDEIIKDNSEILKNDTDNLIFNEIAENNNETSEAVILTSNCYESCEEKDEIMLKESENLAIFKEMFHNMCNCIAVEIKESSKVDVIKILLHGMKTLTKWLAVEKKQNSSDNLKFNHFVKIFELLNEYLESAANQENLKNELETCPNVFETHVYANASWNISWNYIAFLIEYYVVEIFPKFSSLMSLSDSDIFYEKIISITHILRCLNIQYLKSEEHLVLLCTIIQFEFDGSSHAARVLLSDLSTLKRDNVLLMLEENCHVINLAVTHHSIIDTIMTVETDNIKSDLLKILYKCLQRNKIDMYDSILRYILSNYGFTAEMQLPNFYDQLSEFARQTPSLEEAEKIFPVLFIQNPMTSLQYVIDAALVQGTKGKIFIQLLKPFRHICCYVKKYGHISILHKILNDYFNKTQLETYESKNMVTLYKFLMEVHLETPVMLLCTFFRSYLAPKLYPEYDKIELILECAYVLIPALLSDDIFLGHSDFLVNIVVVFGKLVHHFITTRNGKMKSLVICILKELEIHQQNSLQITENEKIKLWSTFKDLNEVTCVYVREFLPRDVEFVSKSYIWTWCCKNEDCSNFENKFSTETLTYVSLMNTLVEVFPHLTQKEWLYSINLLKICFKNLKLKDEVIASNNPFQLPEVELDAFAVILVIISSLHFILVDNIESSLYISSCFSSCLKNSLCQEDNTHNLMFLSIALELCHLISCISSDLIHIYNAILLELKKEIIASCSLENDQKACKKLLNDAVSCLPDLYKEQLTL